MYMRLLKTITISQPHLLLCPIFVKEGGFAERTLSLSAIQFILGKSDMTKKTTASWTSLSGKYTCY